ncbi:MAG: hypothetical protein J6A53_02015 [Clostridia bacterium]|nr:hypothetical protein [Clostridia bacterium]
MVKVKAIKDSIEIKSKPIVPTDFKYKLLIKLSLNYILKSDGKTLLKIDKNEITEEEKKEFLNFYNQSNFDYTFEEFIELHMFPIDTLEIYTKDNNKIAFIDFMPDGDVYLIWIDVYEKEYRTKLIELIQQIN